MAATAVLVATGLAFAWIETRASWTTDWVAIAIGAALALAGAAFQLRSFAAHVVAKGVAWLAFVPSAIYCVRMLQEGAIPGAGTLVMPVGAAAALVLANPILHSDRARSAFGPLARRRLFLGGAIGAAAAGAYALLFALVNGRSTAGVLAIALLATAVGVARMRAWGVLAGLASTVIAFLLPTGTQRDSLLQGVTALPGIVILAAVVLARYDTRRGRAAVERARVGDLEPSAARERSVPAAPEPSAAVDDEPERTNDARTLRP